MKKLLLICLLLASFPALAVNVSSTLKWTYTPGVDDVGKLTGLQHEVDCKVNTTAVIISPDTGNIVAGTITTVTFVAPMNINDTLTCAVRTKRLSDGLVSAWSQSVSKKLIGPPAIPTGLTLELLQAP